MTFSKKLNQFNKDFLGKTSELVEGIEIAISTEVIEKTPVDSGRARANWFPSVNQPSTNITEKVDSDGTISKQRVLGLFRPATPGRRFYLTNNLPYIEDLEYGSSKQAPSGMVRTTVARFKNLVNEQLLKVK